VIDKQVDTELNNAFAMLRFR